METWPLSAADSRASAVARCPGCGGPAATEFYVARGVPVHSCRLVSTREEAMAFPTGDVRLCFCPACGFVFNRAYDPAVQRYAPDYEETQGFSPCFNTFLVGLVRDLVDRRGIRGKTVLEIGCGKGEFLTLLCEWGDNRGIGIDPSYIPKRTDPRVAGRVSFIQDFYSRSYEHLKADVICCRHTLEHIGPTLSFLREIRDSLDGRTDVLLFLEVPDALRVFREGAFWDIYYEHCSYFSAGSLGRLFRAAGFEPTEILLEYGDQYLLAFARPGPASPAPAPSAEDDPAAFVRAIEAFPALCAHSQERWRSAVQQYAARGERAVLWGSGSKGVAFLTTLGLKAEIPAVVDVNPYKQGKFMPGTGQEIVPPARLTEIRPEHVIVMNPIYVDEIRQQLRQLDVQANVWAV